MVSYKKARMSRESSLVEAGVLQRRVLASGANPPEREEVSTSDLARELRDAWNICRDEVRVVPSVSDKSGDAARSVVCGGRRNCSRVGECSDWHMLAPIP
jgi:hypothetical protein